MFSALDKSPRPANEEIMMSRTERPQETVPLALWSVHVYLPDFTCLRQAKNLKDICC